jgi:transposase-like protein
VLVQRRRDDSRAALRLARKLLKEQGFAPRLLVTDKLRSYASAFKANSFSSRTRREQMCRPEFHFRQALDCALRQGALSLELRAATSLARLWQSHTRSEEARELLAPIYERFTEGFDTSDLKAAKSLIDDLSQTARVIRAH